MWDNFMHPSTWWLLSPIFSLLVNFFVQTLSYRVLQNLLKSELVGFIVGLGVMFILSGWIVNRFDLTLSDYWLIVCVNFIIYGVMQIWFNTLLGVISVALRIRILQLVEKKSDHGFSYGEIVTTFNPDELVQRRVARLIKTGQVRNEGGKYLFRNNFCCLSLCFWKPTNSC